MNQDNQDKLLSSSNEAVPQAQTDLNNDMKLLDAYSRAVVSVVDSIGPSVVSINIGWRVHHTGMEKGGAGSGVIFAPDGYILTNSHVVHNATRFEVVLNNNQKYEATLVGEDPATDLAVIRVHDSKFPFAKLGDSASLRVGQLVIAIGNPFGFQSTVSTGVVSALGRHWRAQDGRLIENIVQHTSPLNPGNSGGPLVNSQGNIIGINMAIIAMAQGLGFAIPSNTAKWVVTQIMSHGRVSRGFFGIAGRQREIQQRLVRFYNLKSHLGVEVVEVASGTPAKRAGLKEGDIIVSINEKTVANVDDLHRFLSEWPVGKPVNVSTIRELSQVNLNIVPTEAP